MALSGSTNVLYNLKSLEVRVMKITNLERVFIIATSLVLNKLFFFWLIGARNVFVMLVLLVLLIFNFMILAKSIDKLIDTYEKSKKKQTRTSVEM